VLLCDFDGTLAPIVEVPADARPLDGVPEVLARLARRFASVTVVSGRPVGFLWDRLGQVATGPGPVVRLVGLYGMERAGRDGTPEMDTAVAAWLPVVAEATALLRDGAPVGVRVEPKGAAVTVHFRGAPAGAGWVADRAASVAASTGLVAHPGRLSVELRPPVDVDKGRVVREAARGCSAAAFFGDDLGDLPAFDELDRLAADDGLATVGVAVIDGEAAPEVAARADLSVDGPAGALAVLAWLAGS